MMSADPRGVGEVPLGATLADAEGAPDAGAATLPEDVGTSETGPLPPSTHCTPTQGGGPPKFSVAAQAAMTPGKGRQRPSNPSESTRERDMEKVPSSGRRRATHRARLPQVDRSVRSTLEGVPRVVRRKSPPRGLLASGSRPAPLCFVVEHVPTNGMHPTHTIWDVDGR